MPIPPQASPLISIAKMLVGVFFIALSRNTFPFSWVYGCGNLSVKLFAIFGLFAYLSKQTSVGISSIFLWLHFGQVISDLIEASVVLIESSATKVLSMLCFESVSFEF